MTETETIVKELRSEFKETLDVLVSEIRGLRKELASDKTEWCDGDEAIILLGVKNKRILKTLNDKHLLNRTRNGVTWKYKKSECRDLGQRIFNDKSIIA